MKSLPALIFTAFAIFSGPSSATLISKDFFSAGDGLITFDSETNLEWLDTSLMAGQSFDQITANINNLGAYQGFHLADFDDVATWLRNANFFYEPNQGTQPPGERRLAFEGDAHMHPDRVAALTMMGVQAAIYPNDPGQYTIRAQGFIEGYRGGPGYAFLQFVHGKATYEVNGSITDYIEEGTTVADAGGAFLIRQSTVPEPTSIALLAAGIVGLVLNRRCAKYL